MHKECSSSYAEKGYTLVGLIIAVSVLLIGMMVAVPLWSTVIKREKEKELIFRGEQYALAIQEFKMKTGRDLTDLEELIKVKPRVIRKLWVDPITGKNDWKLVHKGALLAQARQENLGLSDFSSDSEGTGSGLTDSPNLGAPGGPVIGVVSSSNETSIMTYKDKNKYSEWMFTVRVLSRRELQFSVEVSRGSFTGSRTTTGNRRFLTSEGTARWTSWNWND